jgi:hypothetical protein
MKQKNFRLNFAKTLVIFLVIAGSAFGVFSYLNHQKSGSVKNENSSPAIFNTPDGGLVKGEENTTNYPDTTSPKSENYKVKQIRFGGSVVTAPDENIPLRISDVKNETVLDKKQEEAKLIISWKTNKLAISEIEYAQNNGENPKKVAESAYGFGHSATIPDIKPATAYIYLIKAKDRWGNETSSGYYAAFANSKTISIFELIGKNFQDIFGWATK